jgi:hypothetical protein
MLTRARHSAVPGPNLRDERGSITVFFVLFVLIVGAGVGYALYIARITEEKMRTDTAADLAATAMAQHAAIGLNMIAANNIAVAGNLHVGASVPFVGRYWALIEALTLTLKDTETLQELLDDSKADDTPFAKGFKLTTIMTSHFIKTAAGLTAINVQIGKHWMKGGMVKGVEQLRLNKPGDVGLMFQASAADSIGDAASFYNMRYEQLGLSKPKSTMCHAIKSSEVLHDKRDSVAFWVGGAIESITGNTGVVGILETVESLVQGLGSILGSNTTDAVDNARERVKNLTGGFGCGVDIDDLDISRDAKDESKKLCEQINKIGETSTGKFTPSFQDCGINRDGNFGEQFDHFAGAFPSHAHEIGFVVPLVSAGNVEKYEHSLQFAAAVGNPLYLYEELGRSSVGSGSATNCPADWSVEVNGHSYCSVLLDGIDFQYASHSADEDGRNLASGGVSSAVGTNGGQAGKLRNIWSRVQWSLGQAKAEYEPGDGDPVVASAQTAATSRSQGLRANVRRMQYFWPAWKGRLAETSVLAKVLGLLGSPAG